LHPENKHSRQNGVLFPKKQHYCALKIHFLAKKEKTKFSAGNFWNEPNRREKVKI